MNPKRVKATQCHVLYLPVPCRGCCCCFCAERFALVLSTRSRSTEVASAESGLACSKCQSCSGANAVHIKVLQPSSKNTQKEGKGKEVCTLGLKTGGLSKFL